MEKPSLKYIKELSAGDTVFQTTLIKVVQDELPDEISLYEEYMSDSAFAKAAEVVHKIKHKLGILSLEEGYEIAIAYEAQLKEGRVDHKEKFESILKTSLEFISNF